MAVAFVEDGRPRLYVERAGLLALDRPARAVAIAFDGRRVTLVVADEDGLTAARVRAGSPFEVTELGRIVRRGDVRGPLEVRAVGGAHLVFYGLRDAALGVVTLTADGSARDVRYRLDAPCVHLASASGTRRAAVALAYDGDRVERALFDASGKAIERPHAAVRAPGARFVSAQAVWTGRRFAVGGLDAAEGTCTLALTKEDAPLRLAGFRPGALALAHVRDRWVGLQVEREGRRLGLAIRTLAADGSGGEGGVRWFEPKGADERERRGRAAELLRRVHDELRRATYRGGEALVLDVDALRLAVGSTPDAPALRLIPRGESLDVELEPGGPREPAGGVLDRIAGLFDRGPSAARRAAWARAITDGLFTASTIRARGRRVLVALDAYPSAASLAELLRRARARAPTR